MSATVENAETIVALTRDAADHLIAAERSISEALRFASEDYQHNDEKLRHMLGAVHLLSGIAAGEQYVWQDYLQARRAARVRNEVKP